MKYLLRGIMNTKGIQHFRDFEGSKFKNSSIVVVVTLYGGGDLWAKCLTSLISYTDPKIPIVVFEDAYPDDLAIDISERVTQEQKADNVFLHRNQRNLGVVGNLNCAFELLNPADVTVVNSDVIVGEGWLEGLIGGLADPSVATVTALTTNSEIFTIHEARRILGLDPAIQDVNEIAKIVKTLVPNPIYPDVPTTISCCSIFRRRALNIAGDLDMIFSPGYGEETDFSCRATKLGFRHVAAENVFVYHEGGTTFGSSQTVSKRKLKNDLEVFTRYPFFEGLVKELETNSNHPLKNAIHYIEANLRGLDIVFDGTLFDENYTGTFVGILGMISALSQHESVRQVYIGCDAYRVNALKSQLKKHEINVQVLNYQQVRNGQFDIGFVPHQVYSKAFFDSLAESCYRRMFWHLDFISTTTPFYHHSEGAFFSTRDFVKDSFREADGVFYLTPTTKMIAKSLGQYVEDSRSFILPIAPDIQLRVLESNVDLNEDIPKQYLLVIGVSYAHKGRGFILDVFNEISSNFPGLGIVFAGPYPDFGAEKILTTASVIDLGRVDEKTKIKLIQNALLVLSPSVIEGFGLAPLEAALLGTPAIVSQTVGHLDHGSAPYWINLDSKIETGNNLRTLISSENERTRQLMAWESNLEKYSWETSANLFVEGALKTIKNPPRIHVQKYIAVTGSQHGKSISSRMRDFVQKSKLLPQGSVRRKILVSIYRKFK